MITDQAIFPLVKLSDLVEIQIGKTPSRDNPSFWGEGYTWVSISDLNGNKYITNSKEQITHLGVQSSNIKSTKAGVLLFSYKLSIGKVAFAGKDLYTNEAIASMIIKENVQLLNDYFYFVMREFDFTGTSDKAAKGQTLNKAKLKELKIPLPPLETQKKIAAILDAADAYRQKTKALIEKYDELAQSLFLEMFGDPVKNEKGWEMKVIQDLIVEVKKIDKNFKHATIEYIDISSIDRKSNKISSTNRHLLNERPSRAQQVLRKGDIILSMVRPNLKNIAINNTDNFIASTGFFVFRSVSLSTHYLFELLKSDSVTNYLSGITAGANYPAIKNSDIRTMKIPVPPFGIQNQFAQRIQEIESQKALAKKAMKKSEELFNSLLQKAFNGTLLK